MDSNNIILSPKHSSNLELTVCDYVVATIFDLVSLQVESCKDAIYIPNSIEINLPNLQYAGTIFARNATTLNLPNLQESEYINAANATTVNLPNLQKSRNIYTEKAKKIIIPSNLKRNLKDYPDDCKIIHPDLEATPKLESFKTFFYK